MNKISIKWATYFIVTVLIMEAMLMLYLHQTIAHTRINEEFSQLMLKGSNHRDVLEDNFPEDTMRHIVLMENDSERRFAITDDRFKLVISSDGSSANLETLFARISKEKFIED